MSWHKQGDIQVKLTPYFDQASFAKSIPGPLQGPLLNLLKEDGASSVQNIHDLIWDTLSSHGQTEVLKSLFQLDTLFCTHHLQLQFGPRGLTPLATLRACGQPNPIPVARACWDERDHARRTIILSRFAYFHRFGHELILERPLAHLRCAINSELLHQILFACSQKAITFNELLKDCPPLYRSSLCELLGVLERAKFLEVLPEGQKNLDRNDEASPLQAQWDFHNLLFHSETFQAHAHGPLLYGFGRTFPYQGRFSPEPGLHPSYPGEKIDLPRSSSNLDSNNDSLEQVLQQRKSLRDYDISRPITKEEIGVFLSRLYRGCSKVRPKEGPMEILQPRSYPSGGSLYEQEIYLSLFRCKKLPVGFYHYDSSCHALVPIAFPAQSNYPELYQSLSISKDHPDIIFHISARFHRMSWKYSQISYAVSLKNLGAMYQTMYLIATSMKLAPCAGGSGNARIFSLLTQQDPYREGLLGEFYLGRPQTTQ